MRYAILALACFALLGCDEASNVTEKAKEITKEVIDKLKEHGAEQCKQYSTVASCSLDTQCKWVDAGTVAGCMPK